ncbi:MAG: hypothetical protein U0350_18560 [Caldilineaceae bacterium]
MMALDLNQLIQVQQDALLRDFGEEVELIFRYGSFLKNATHRYSDLDIFYVPVHEATWHSITVMVDDMLCDLYLIHWSRLESMANFENVSRLEVVCVTCIFSLASCILHPHHPIRQSK